MIGINKVFKKSAQLVIMTIILSIMVNEIEGKISYTRPLHEGNYRSRNYMSKRLYPRTTSTTTTTTTTGAPYFPSLEEEDDSYDETLQLPSEIEERFIQQNNLLERASEIAEEESQIFEKIAEEENPNALKNFERLQSSEENFEESIKDLVQEEEEEENEESKVQEDEKIAIMDIPLVTPTSTITFHIVSTTPVPTTLKAPEEPDSQNLQAEASFVSEALVRPSRSASFKAHKKNSIKSDDVFESSEERDTPPKKRNNVPCTCGVFLTHQIQKGSSAEPEGDAIITNELDKIYKCNSVGQKQCQTKCLETLVQHLPNSASILCATLNKDIRKERAYLYIKNCQDKWISTSLTAGKEYCCKNGKPYSCPMV